MPDVLHIENMDRQHVDESRAHYPLLSHKVQYY